MSKTGNYTVTEKQLHTISRQRHEAHFTQNASIGNDRCLIPAPTQQLSSHSLATVTRHSRHVISLLKIFFTNSCDKLKLANRS